LLTTGHQPLLHPVVVSGERVVWVFGGGARAGPAAGRVALRGGPAPALAPFPVPGRISLWTASCCWGGWLVLVRAAVHSAQSVAACARGPPSSTSASTSGLSRSFFPCQLWQVVGLGGFPAGRDRWGGERVVGGVLPRISVGTWCLCDSLCLVLVCGGGYGLGGGFFSSFWDRVWAE
jgi:hypothetical protein